MGAQFSLFNQPKRPTTFEWTHDPVDQEGLAAFTHLIRAPDDPDRSPRPHGGRADKTPHQTLRRGGRETFMAWRSEIVATLGDGTPRTFHRLCVEIADLGADIGFQETPDFALWSLVDQGILEHTLEAPILFRLRAANAGQTTAPEPAALEAWVDHCEGAATDGSELEELENNNEDTHHEDLSAAE